MRKIILLFVILGGGALCFLFIRGSIAFDRRALLHPVDLIIDSSARFNGSRLGAYLDKSAGSCVFRDKAASRSMEPETDGSYLDRIPFGQPFFARLPFSVIPMNFTGREPIAIANCRDGIGGEIHLKAVPLMAFKIRIDRAIHLPLRFSLSSVTNFEFSGKNLWFVLDSPLGDLEVRANGDAELSLNIQQDSSGSPLKMAVTAGLGEFHVARAYSSVALRQGVVDLRAETGGRIRWENEKKPVTARDPAVVVPSGLYWSNANTPTN